MFELHFIAYILGSRAAGAAALSLYDWLDNAAPGAHEDDDSQRWTVIPPTETPHHAGTQLLQQSVIVEVVRPEPLILLDALTAVRDWTTSGQDGATGIRAAFLVSKVPLGYWSIDRHTTHDELRELTRESFRKLVFQIRDDEDALSHSAVLGAVTRGGQNNGTVENRPPGPVMGPEDRWPGEGDVDGEE